MNKRYRYQERLKRTENLNRALENKESLDGDYERKVIPREKEGRWGAGNEPGVLSRPKHLPKPNRELFTETLCLNKSWQVRWKINNKI